MHKTFRIILVFILIFTGCISNHHGRLKYSQVTTTEIPSVLFSNSWTKAEIDSANTASLLDYLTDQEKEVIKLCNLARADGRKFADSYLKSYRNSNSQYVKSLFEDLYSVNGLDALQPNQGLCEAAESHAIDMGKHGAIGHDSSDGTSFYNRVRRYYSGQYVGENCCYGRRDAINIVLDLLIDENVPSLGHRKNILNDSFKEVGVAIRTHSSYHYNCVIDFGACSELTYSSSKF